MKSVLITFDQAYYERIIVLLDNRECGGCDVWSRVDPLLSALREMDEATPKLGLRAFVWGIERSI